jgi:NADPH2:quinone reductase
LPFSPGAECAGTVEALGQGVSGWRIGERVAGFPGFNGCRERIVVRADRLLAVPDGVSDEQAAGLIVTYGTSLHALKDRARLEPGETLAVLGAAGGVGLAAVEIGQAMGARVIACASSQDKLDLARRHGAELTLDYAKEDLKEGLRRLTQGKGVDVIYDPVGGDLSEAALRSIAWQGRFLVIGFAAGTIPKIPLNLALLKGCDIKGVFWGSFIERDREAHRANMAQIFAWTLEKKLSAHVHAVFPLADTADALGLLLRREARGKVLVKI